MSVIDIILITTTVLLAGWATYLTLLLLKVKQQREALMQIKDLDLETVLNSHEGKLQQNSDDIATIYEIADKIHKMAAQGMQKTHVTRFNPFEGGEGGNTSFAMALLDKSDTGIVISSLQTREGTKIYAKGITEGQSEMPLTAEEKRTIEKAIQQYKN